MPFVQCCGVRYLFLFLVRSFSSGRTFDEIREENRHQQLEQNFPRSSRFPTKEPGHGEEQSSREYPQSKLHYS